MPLYEYQCTACGHRFEVIRKFSDAPLTECPRCKGQVEKLVSSPAFHLKGSGWYATDYAKKSDSSKSETKTESAASESKPAESTTKDSSSSSDSSSKDAASSTPKSSS